MNAHGREQTEVIADATCLACGCLCDDIQLELTNGRLVHAQNACELGQSWFLAPRDPCPRPSATIDGCPVTTDQALDRAARLLAAASAPLILGLTRTTVETVAEAVALADHLGAALDLSGPAESSPMLAAFQRVGKVSATLGEVRDRADVVVFWEVDPLTTHPRHWERYSIEPPGRFTPRGRADRTVLVADSRRTPTAERADRFLRLEPTRRYETLTALRAWLRGITLDEAPDPALTAWAEPLKTARYAAVFFDHGLEDAASVTALLTLVRDLNATARCVALPLGGPGNLAGAEAVLAWQAGAPRGVEFSAGFPRVIPGESSAWVRLARGEADAALIVADPVNDPSARAALARIPTVVIAPDATDPSWAATVGLAAATTGIHAAGTVVRCDGIWLPLRPAINSPWPTDHALLRQLAARLISRRA